MAVTLREENGIYHFRGRSPQLTQEKNKLLQPENKMLFNYGQTFCLLPEAEQQNKIDRTIGCARTVANDFRAVKDFLWKEYGISVSNFQYRKEYYPILCAENPWLKECHQGSVLSGVDNMDKAFQNFYAGRSKYPKNVSKGKPNGQRYSTPNDHESIHIDIINSLPYISIPKVGKVRFVLPKNMTVNDIFPDENTRITSITVSHDGTGYSVSLQMESIVDLVNAKKNISISRIGSMDMGLKDFGIYGDSENTHKVKNPRWIKKSERKLRRAQQALSRKYESAVREGRNYWEGKNYQKAKAKVVRIQKHIANQRKDFHHKLSRIIADTYDAFIFENLNIKGLLKNHRLAKSISSVGWYQFQQFVKYKIERKGGTILKIDRFFPSSKTCGHCGYINKELQLNERYWYCPKCHTLHDRDINAKDNILKEGIRIMETSDYQILPA